VKTTDAPRISMSNENKSLILLAIPFTAWQVFKIY